MLKDLGIATVSEIASELGCDEIHLYHVLKDLGIRCVPISKNVCIFSLYALSNILEAPERDTDIVVTSPVHLTQK